MNEASIFTKMTFRRGMNVTISGNQVCTSDDRPGSHGNEYLYSTEQTSGLLGPKLFLMTSYSV